MQQTPSLPLLTKNRLLWRYWKQKKSFPKKKYSDFILTVISRMHHRTVLYRPVLYRVVLSGEWNEGALHSSFANREWIQ